MSSPGLQKPIAAEQNAAPPPDILPTLFGEGYGDYRIRPTNFIISFVLHSLALALIIYSGLWIAAHRQDIKAQITQVFTSTDPSPYILPAAKDRAGGGGGGGDQDKLQASKGVLPRASNEQFTPPVVVIRNIAPKLEAQPTVIAPPSLVLPQNGQLGDPMSTIFAPASNGTGSGGGIGSGSGGGVGSGRGPGVGPGWGGGIGGGAYRVGGGVSAPRPVYDPDPEYSEEARKAKFQGTVILWVVIGPDGRPRDMRVQRSLGMGLDEKAMEAVKRWRFEPARKDGQPVPVQINVEVNFRLY